MADMKLMKLSLRNFKGIPEFTFELGGKDTAVYGDNATGKTTLADSWFWLLFDKDSLNKADFDIKTLDADGKPQHGLDHEVEGVLDVDGDILTLRKVYSEIWTKKRGSAAREFTGHTTDHFLNGVPVRKGEYEARIAVIVKEDAFKLLTNPRYFNEVLHWQERRKILLEVCGDVSDEDVIAGDLILWKLPTILNGRPLEDHRKVLGAKRSEIQKELERVPIRIDETHRGLPGEGESQETILALLAGLKVDRSKKSQEIATLEAGGGIAGKTKELREVEAEQLNIKNEHLSQISDKLQTAKVELRNVEAEASDIEAAIKSNQRIVSATLDASSLNDGSIELMRQEWQQENAREFTFEQSDTCPTCGQSLPAEQVKAAREKAQSSFNVGKARNLEEILNKGLQTRDRNEKLLNETAAIEQLITEGKAKLVGIEPKIVDIRQMILSLEQQGDDYTSTPAYKDLDGTRRAIEQQLEGLRASGADEIGFANYELETIDNHIADVEQALSEFNQRTTGLKRIEELKAQERELAAEYERLEQELYLTEQFVRVKVKLLEAKINSHFQHAQFKLFEEQVNGAIAECCETTYKGIPYSSALNNSARINIGLDIINALGEHFRFVAPIWMDNAEAVTQLLPTKGQQIKLYVSEVDKVLRVESIKEN